MKDTLFPTLSYARILLSISQAMYNMIIKHFPFVTNLNVVVYYGCVTEGDFDRNVTYRL